MSVNELNFYQILEVNKNSTPKEIKKSYMKLSLKWHPDKWATKSLEEKEKANEKMKKINSAYEVLRDSENRNNYDNSLVNDKDNSNKFSNHSINNNSKNNNLLVGSLTIGGGLLIILWAKGILSGKF